MKAYQTAITALGVLLVMLITAFAVVMTMLVAADTPRPPLRLDLGTITVPATVQEDDPQWDCRTMGNRVCGEVKP